MRYRRKGHEIYQAEQYQPNMAVLPAGVVEESTGPDLTGHISAFVRTPFSRQTVAPGDWVLTDVHGDRYVCPPDVFAVSFESFEAQQPVAYAPWETYRHLTTAEALPIAAPPCTTCKNFRPVALIDPRFGFDGVRLCHAEDMFPDFSCYEPKEAPTL